MYVLIRDNTELYSALTQVLQKVDDIRCNGYRLRPEIYARFSGKPNLTSGHQSIAATFAATHFTVMRRSTQ